MVDPMKNFSKSEILEITGSHIFYVKNGADRDSGLDRFTAYYNCMTQNFGNPIPSRVESTRITNSALS